MRLHYTFTIGSPVDYEELVAYIWVDDQQIAIVQKEEGNDKMILEFFEPIESKIYLDSFFEVLKEAKESLSK